MITMEATHLPLALGLAAAVVIDCRSRRIPNYLSISLLLGGIVAALAAAGGVDLPGSLAGILVGLLAFLPLYALGGFGAGDVKLMAASGAWLGPKLTAVAIVATLLAGAVMGLIVAAVHLIARRRQSLGAILALAMTAPAVLLATLRGVRFPYALAIAAGTGYALLVPR